VKERLSLCLRFAGCYSYPDHIIVILSFYCWKEYLGSSIGIGYCSIKRGIFVILWYYTRQTVSVGSRWCLRNVVCFVNLSVKNVDHKERSWRTSTRTLSMYVFSGKSRIFWTRKEQCIFKWQLLAASLSLLICMEKHFGSILVFIFPVWDSMRLLL